MALYYNPRAHRKRLAAKGLDAESAVAEEESDEVPDERTPLVRARSRVSEALLDKKEREAVREGVRNARRGSALGE